MFATGNLLARAFAPSTATVPSATAQQQQSVGSAAAQPPATQANRKTPAVAFGMLGVIAVESAVDRISDLLEPVGLHRVCWTPVQRVPRSGHGSCGKQPGGDPVTTKQKHVALYTAVEGCDAAEAEATVLKGLKLLAGYVETPH